MVYGQATSLSRFSLAYHVVDAAKPEKQIVAQTIGEHAKLAQSA